MIGIDISNYQSSISISKNANYIDFVIVKATEGKSFTDKSFHSHIEQIIANDKLIGAYHFARPDLHGTVKLMEDEADYFIKVCQDADIIGKAILVLDWEREPYSNKDLILAWLNRVVQSTGVTPFIYGSKSKLTTTAFKSLINDWPIWMAVWPSIKQIPISGAMEWAVSNYPSNTVIPWEIWQFSAKGVLDGFTGDVDLDYTHMNQEQWRYYAKSVFYNNKNISDSEHISEDMRWAIEVGLFSGFTDGTFRPKDPLTREHAATLLRREYDIIMKDMWDAIRTYYK